MKKQIVCVTCPIGCSISVELEGKIITAISGNRCKRGAAYAAAEVTNPVRVLTTTMATEDGRLVSVKTSAPVPKVRLMELMRMIGASAAPLPIRIGDVLIPDIGGSGVNIIATKELLS